MYEKYDLTHLISGNDRFVVRQGDLVITSYHVDNYRMRGLRRPWSQRKGNIYKYLGSHIVIPLESETVLIHNEHGVVIIPRSFNELEFYTFNDAGD
jgi:hypothetical protein